MIILAVFGLKMFSMIVQSDKLSLVRIYVERCLLQQEHNQILDNLHDAIITKDKHGIKYFNKQGLLFLTKCHSSQV